MVFAAETGIALVRILVAFYGFWLVWRVLLPILPGRTDEADEFLARVGERLEAGETDRGHRREILIYDGLAWRGELWLDADLRLGPPSKFPEALSGCQVVVVDAMVEGIGQQGVTANFQTRVHELVIFLGFVFGMRPAPVRWRQELSRAWSATSFFKRRFSDSSSRSLRASSADRDP